MTDPHLRQIISALLFRFLYLVIDDRLAHN
jgi:hypothetical protein